MIRSWRTGAARKAAATRKAMVAARGEEAACARCGGPRDRTGVYCRGCHAEYMRDWRRDRALTEQQKAKDNTRSYAGVYKRRGELVPQPCAKCGAPGAETHHADYSKPLEVVWLCRSCHLELYYPPPEGDAPCAREGCGNVREVGSYCRPCWAAYMREYRRLRKAGERGVTHETAAEAAEEASMIEMSETRGNGLSQNGFADDAEHDQPAGALRFMAPAAETGYEAVRAELEEAGDELPALSAAEYLIWLAQERTAALRAAEESLAGSHAVRLEPLEDRVMVPLREDSPPLFRRFLEVMVRLSRQDLETARRVASRLASQAEALDAGLRTTPQQG